MNLLDYSERYGLPPKGTIITISRKYEKEFPSTKKGTVLRILKYEDVDDVLTETCVMCVNESFSKFLYKFEINSFMEKHNSNLVEG